jgi:hypothetical protein
MLKPIRDLSRDELEEIVHTARAGLFRTEEWDWDANKSVSGADFVDLMLVAMAKHGLVPEPPFDKQILTIEVRGGVVTDVRNLPEGYCYELDDTDNDGDGDWDLDETIQRSNEIADEQQRRDEKPGTYPHLQDPSN